MSSVLNSPSHKFLSFSQTRNICLMILVRHVLLVINLRERNGERQRWMKRGSKKGRVAVVTSALLGFKKALFIFGDQSRILRRQWFSFRVSWFIVCWSKLHLAIHARLNTGESSMTNTEPQEISYNQARYWFKHSNIQFRLSPTSHLNTEENCNCDFLHGVSRDIGYHHKCFRLT